MPSSPQDSVALVEQLLKLVKTISEPDVEPLTAWNTKVDIQNACDLLLVKTLGRLEYTINIAESCQESSALQFATTLGIAESIGDGEASLAELCLKAEVPPQFLGPVLDCLIGRGYFEEVGRFGSRVYKNNYLSEVLRPGHPSSLKAAIGLACDEGLRATSRLVDAAKLAAKVDGGHSQEKLHASNIAFGFSGSIFEWMSRPEEAWRGKRVGEAMPQYDRIANAHTSEDYPWHKLSSPIVDIGGGNGSLEMCLLNDERHQNLQFVIFDIPKTIENAQKFWSIQPTAMASRVSFVGGNFMASSFSQSNIPQGKPTYVIRHVLHNWTDDDVVYILSMVRQAMTENNGRLLLVEMLSRSNSGRLLRATGMQLLALSNGITRTHEELEGLVKRAGFKVAGITHMRALDSVIEAVVE